MENYIDNENRILDMSLRPRTFYLRHARSAVKALPRGKDRLTFETYLEIFDDLPETDRVAIDKTYKRIARIKGMGHLTALETLIAITMKSVNVD